MIERLNDDNVGFDVMGVLENAITDSFIEQLRDETIDLEDEMLTSFLAVVLKSDKQIDFIKAIGLSKFRDDREVCLAINDFCGALKDLRRIGEKKLHDK